MHLTSTDYDFHSRTYNGSSDAIRGGRLISDVIRSTIRCVIYEVENSDFVKKICFLVDEVLQGISEVYVRIRNQVSSLFCFPQIDISNAPEMVARKVNSITEEVIVPSGTPLSSSKDDVSDMEVMQRVALDEHTLSALNDLLSPAIIARGAPYSGFFAYTSTCKILKRRRWQRIAHDPKMINHIVHRAILKDCIAFTRNQDTCDSGIIQMPVAHNVVNKFRAHRFLTDFSLEMDHFSLMMSDRVFNIDSVVYLVYKLLERFPRTSSIELGGFYSLSEYGFSNVIDLARSIQHIRARVPNGSAINKLLLCPSLESLDVISFGEQSLDAPITSLSTTLKRLNLTASNINDLTFCQLMVACPQLEMLTLEKCCDITPDGFAKAQFPGTITRLELSYTFVDSNGLSCALKRCFQLQSLMMKHCLSIAAQGFAEVVFPRSLREIYLDETSVNDAALRSILMKCPELHYASMMVHENISQEELIQLQLDYERCSFFTGFIIEGRGVGM